MAKGGNGKPAAAGDESSETSTSAPARPRSTRRLLEIEGYPVEGISVAGKETCVIFPSLNLAFDIGCCPPLAVSQDLLFVSHAHMDHIGELPRYVGMRGRKGMRPPTVFVPACIADLVRRLFEVYRDMDQSVFEHKLVPLEVGEAYELGKGLRVKTFRTYHRVPSQGYVIYKVKQKLKDEYAGLPGKELSSLTKSEIEITNTLSTPEIAFTGDTTSDFILDPDNADVLKAKILVVESTYIDDSKSIADAREKGHTHLSEIVSLCDKLENRAILLNHFSARYTAEDIDAAISRLSPPFRSKVHALKDGKSAAAGDESPETSTSAPARQRAMQRLKIEGYAVEGISVAGNETCVIFPSLNLAFDIGGCPPLAVSQDLLFVSHAHMDHIRGLPKYVGMRVRLGMHPPTVFVPACSADLVRRLFEVYTDMDQSGFEHKLVPLEVGEEYELGKGLRVRAFKTYHVVPSQGYVIYKVKQKLKDEYAGLPGKELSSLRKSGIEITNTVSTPEIAFTGDTMSDFILDPDNADVLKAKILVVESTYIDDSKSIEDAREKGHTHLSEWVQIASMSDKLENKAILLNHFSSRYNAEDIDAAISRLPPPFRSKVHALKEGF